MDTVQPTPTVPGHPSPMPSPTGKGPCPACAERVHTPDQFVYALGRLDVRFPSLGIEREFQQRERAISNLPQHPRTARILAVLEKNPHLALRVGYTFQIGASPVFALQPSSGALKEAFFKALAHSHDASHICVLIGRSGGFSSPPSWNGLLLSSVAADQLYSFTFDEWAEGLSKTAEAALKTRKLESSTFRANAQNLLRETIAMPENMGLTDGHRALNYLAVQHPGLFLAAAERREHVLDRIDTRVSQTAGGRRHVTVILQFLDRTTGVPERLSCTVDVTEEWPFVAGPDGAGAPLGFMPFVETSMFP
ncbi:MAG TPA: hypothetical protein VFU48_06425 [Nitrospira sp.]|nr:hypothetical protein [Nitrospira sp.]